jgi:hypothetical protein
MTTPYFTNNNTFQKRKDKLYSAFGNSGVRQKLEIMDEIIKESPTLDIVVFYAIIDKLVDPTISNFNISGNTYLQSVKLWNKHIMNQYIKYDKYYSFDVLIKHESLVC